MKKRKKLNIKKLLLIIIILIGIILKIFIKAILLYQKKIQMIMM